MAPASSDLSLIIHSSSGKLKQIRLRKLNRNRKTREAKGPPPILSRENRAQGFFRLSLRSLTGVRQ